MRDFLKSRKDGELDGGYPRYRSYATEGNKCACDLDRVDAPKKVGSQAQTEKSRVGSLKGGVRNC